MSITLEQALGNEPITTGAEELVQAEPEQAAKVEVKEPDQPAAPKEAEKADSSPESESSSVPSVVMHKERERRQEAEKRLREYEKKLTEYEQEKAKRPSVFEDEEGAFSAVQTSVEQRVTNELLQAGQAEAENAFGAELVQEASDWLLKAASESPSMAAQIKGVPTMFLHRKAVELYQAEQARAELSDPDALKAKLREEVKAELEAERKAAEDEKKRLRESIPKSLVGESSKGSLKGGNWGGPTPLKSIIGE